MNVWPEPIKNIEETVGSTLHYVNFDEASGDSTPTARETKAQTKPEQNKKHNCN